MFGGVLTVRERLEDILFIGACVVVGEIGMHGDAAKLAHLGMVQVRIRDVLPDDIRIDAHLESLADLVCLPLGEVSLREDFGCWQAQVHGQVVERRHDVLNLVPVQRVLDVAFVKRKHLEARELAVEAVAEVYGDVLTGLDDVRVDFRLGHEAHGGAQILWRSAVVEDGVHRLLDCTQYVHGVRVIGHIHEAVAGEVIAVDRIPCDGRVARYSVIDVTEVEAQQLQHVGDVLVVCHGVFLPFYHDGLLYTYTMEWSSRAGESSTRPSASFSEAARASLAAVFRLTGLAFAAISASCFSQTNLVTTLRASPRRG
ncbi:Uncharacterised protein [uncultured Clostridium sp.]|nr:Uncharacterised protein [uncultured Clostridium sp.]